LLVAKIPVSFVTFNYDRSLEHFLYTYLLGNFADAVPSDVVNVIGRLPIIHVYGSLGPLPWQDADGRDYSPTISPEIVAAAAKGITILHQGNDDSPEFQQAQELFKKADSILLLGFGYPRENMRRLNLPFLRLRGQTVPHDTRPVQIWGTAYGLTEAEASRLRVLYGNRWTTAHATLQICDALRTNSDFVECVNG
jgi:hypothetical protein